MAYYCYKCGYSIQDGMIFCSKCGANQHESNVINQFTNLIDPYLPMVTEYDDRYDKSTFEEVVNAARRGDVAAIYELGSRYRLGVDGAERNEAQAISLYKEVLKYQNNRDAFYHIGFMLSDGALGEQHENECVRYFEAAYEMGSGTAATQLAILYEYGRSYIKQDYERALDYYDKAIKLGNANGTERTCKARLLEQLGRDELAKQCYCETLQYYNDELQNGKPEDAAWCLGEMGSIYQHLGESLKAKQCFELAVKKGKNAQAATELGAIYEDGIPGVLETNLAEALYYYQLGYDTRYDDYRAVFNINMLAQFYFKEKAGKGKDYDAFKLFKEIYDLGYNSANLFLGFYYGTGIPGYVEVDINKAFSLLDDVESYDETTALYYKGVISLNTLHDADSTKVFLANAVARGNQQAKELLHNIERS